MYSDLSILVPWYHFTWIWSEWKVLEKQASALSPDPRGQAGQRWPGSRARRASWSSMWCTWCGCALRGSCSRQWRGCCCSWDSCCLTRSLLGRLISDGGGQGWLWGRSRSGVEEPGKGGEARTAETDVHRLGWEKVKGLGTAETSVHSPTRGKNNNKGNNNNKTITIR